MKGSGEPGGGHCLGQARRRVFVPVKPSDVPSPGSQMPPTQSSHSASSLGLRPDHRSAPPWPPMSLHGHPLSLAWTSSLPDATLGPFQPMPQGALRKCTSDLVSLLLLILPWLPRALRIQSRLLPVARHLSALISSTLPLAPSSPATGVGGPPPYCLNIPNSLQPQGLCTCYSSNLECSSLSCHLTPIGGIPMSPPPGSPP